MAQFALIYNAIIDGVKALVGLATIVTDIATYAHDKLQGLLDALKHTSTPAA